MLSIEPNEEHTGDFTVKMTLLNNQDEYKRSMLLKVVGKTETVSSQAEEMIDENLEFKNETRTSL